MTQTTQTNQNFKKYLNRTKTRLDVSIQSADKWFSTGSTNNIQNKIQEFLESETTVEHKTDGVKLTVIKHQNTGTINDYIFAYKGNILFESEFDYQTDSEIDESIGCSQFKRVFQHFKKLKENTIPEGTELCIEFLMKKPTLSSQYTDLHKMVLIGYSECSFKEEFGKLVTESQEMATEKREQYANELNIDIPQLLFKGSMHNENAFAKGICNIEMQHIFANYEQNNAKLQWGNQETLLQQIKHMFLLVQSKYGGLEEGVILTNNRVLKWQQDYQNNQAARNKIKSQYREDDSLAESKYWEKVKAISLELSKSVHITDNINSNLQELSEKLSLLSADELELTHQLKHTKKCYSIIKDDIQLNAKTLILKEMKGNNNALIVGKFRVLTEQGHVKLIEKALQDFDNVIICLVTSKDSKGTQDLRESLIAKTFPDVTIIHASNANLIRVLQKSPKNINAIYAGTDRVQQYNEQIKNMLGIQVIEMARTDEDISASKLIENLNDRSYFIRNTPKSIHEYYDLIKETYAES